MEKILLASILINWITHKYTMELSSDEWVEMMWKRALLTIENILIQYRKQYTKFRIHPTEHHILFAEPSSTTHQTLLLFFCSKEKCNLDNIKEMLQVLDNYNLSSCFFVYRHALTASAKKVLEHISQLQQYNIELWNLKELQYDVTQHQWYCPHELMTSLEVETLFPQKQTTLASLPKILKQDIIVRIFGFQRQDILRIRRKDGSLAYRVVK